MNIVVSLERGFDQGVPPDQVERMVSAEEIVEMITAHAEWVCVDAK